MAPAKAEEENLLENVTCLFRSKRYSKVVSTVEKIDNPTYELIYYKARALANLGKTKEAHETCIDALDLNDLFAPVYALKSHLVLERGSSSEAAALLNKAIYLDPEYLPAYIFLAEIYHGEQNLKKMRLLLSKAVSLLESMERDRVIEYYEDRTVDEMIIYVNEMFG